MGFDELYQQYFKDIYHYLLGMSRDPHLSEEITQETFYKALRSLDSFDGRKDIRAWLFTIAKNTYLSHKKKIAAAASSSRPRMPLTISIL